MKPAGIYSAETAYEPLVWADPKAGTWFFKLNGYLETFNEPVLEPETPNEFRDGDWDHRIGNLLIPMNLWRW